MQAVQIPMIASLLAASASLMLSGCAFETKSKSIMNEGSIHAANSTGDINDQHPEQLCLELVLFRVDWSNYSVPINSIQFWLLMYPGDDPVKTLDTLLTGQEQIRIQEDNLYCVELDNPAGFLGALDHICDTALIATPKITLLQEHGNAITVRPGIKTTPYVPSNDVSLSSMHPLENYGLELEVQAWEDNSTTFTLSASHPPTEQSTDRVSIDRPTTIPLVHGQSYIVGGFADWQYHDGNDSNEHHELIAIVKVSKVNRTDNPIRLFP